MRDELKRAFENHSWTGRRGRAPRSGPGSTLGATERLRAALPAVFEHYDVHTFLDAPCGDWTWMQEVDLSQLSSYHGADISSSVVESVAEKHSPDKVSFSVLDITSDPLPDADMMMCRECIFHLKHAYKRLFFQNFVKSRIPYLLLTMDHVKENIDLNKNGGFQRFNPMGEPFNFPPPLNYVHESSDREEFDIHEPGLRRQHRSMAVWSRKMIETVLPD